MEIIIQSPDCRDANHNKCNGEAWDMVFDEITLCKCTCHA